MFVRLHPQPNSLIEMQSRQQMVVGWGGGCLEAAPESGQSMNLRDKEILLVV